MMIQNYREKLNALSNKIDAYVDLSFQDPEEDFETNKNLKKGIQDTIEEIFKDGTLTALKKKELINTSLLLLASKTGCAEDLEIAEAILDELSDLKIITQEQIDFFYDNAGTKRWE